MTKLGYAFLVVVCIILLGSLIKVCSGKQKSASGMSMKDDSIQSTEKAN